MKSFFPKFSQTGKLEEQTAVLTALGFVRLLSPPSKYMNWEDFHHLYFLVALYCEKKIPQQGFVDDQNPKLCSNSCTGRS